MCNDRGKRIFIQAINNPKNSKKKSEEWVLFMYSFIILMELSCSNITEIVMDIFSTLIVLPFKKNIVYKAIDRDTRDTSSPVTAKTVLLSSYNLYAYCF